MLHVWRPTRFFTSGHGSRSSTRSPRFPRLILIHLPHVTQPAPYGDARRRSPRDAHDAAPLEPFVPRLSPLPPSATPMPPERRATAATAGELPLSPSPLPPSLSDLHVTGQEGDGGGFRRAAPPFLPP